MGLFSDCFMQFAERPCLRAAGRELSYADVAELGRSLIKAIPASRILIVLKCSLTIECVAIYCALLEAGHVPLLLESDLAPELVDRIVETYAVDAILDGAGGIVWRKGGNELHPNLALLLSTSGSTGSPKLVRLSHAGILANAVAVAQSLDLDTHERPLLHLPMSYSYGLSIIHSHLLTGGCIGLTRSSVMESGYFDDMTGHAATSIAGVPFHYTALRRLLGKINAPSLRTLTQAGGRLDPRIVSFFVEWAVKTNRRFVVMYGQTEAGPRISVLPPERALSSPAAIGLPIPGVTIHLLDESGKSVSEGETGEMIVESAGVMMGYALSAADLAKGDVLHGRLPTGDLAQRASDGLLTIVGRRSRIIKVYGLRVNADEVEQRLADLGYMATCYGGDDVLRVLIEGQADAAGLRQRIVDIFSLPPRGIEVRTSEILAREPSGKLSASARDAGWEAAAKPV